MFNSQWKKTVNHRLYNKDRTLTICLFNSFIMQKGDVETGIVAKSKTLGNSPDGPVVKTLFPLQGPGIKPWLRN